MINKRATLLLCLAIAAAAPAFAKDDYDPTLPLHNMANGIVDQLCPNFVDKFNEDMSKDLQAKPIEVSKVCECAKSKFTEDKKVNAQLNHTMLDLKKIFKKEATNDTFSTYLASRVFANIFTCLGPEMNQRLDDFPFDAALIGK